MRLFILLSSVSSLFLHIFFPTPNISYFDVLLALSIDLNVKYFLFIAPQCDLVKTLHFSRFYNLTINFRMSFIFLTFSFAIQLIFADITLQYFSLSFLATFASQFYISEWYHSLFFDMFQYCFLKFYFLFLILLS